MGKGIEILESLQGHTSGFAVPTFVIDAPGGGGKIPVMPNYIISWSTHKTVLRNYEGVITTYHEPENYRPPKCDRDCQKCHLQLNLESHKAPEGVEGLLADADKHVSLVPEGNVRHGRRKKPAVMS